MKILYYDCFSGISGDMNLGAMIDLGIEEEFLRSELGKLNVAGWDIKVEKGQRHGITGTMVTVIQTAHEHAHRHPSDIEKIIDESKLSFSVKELSRKIFREVAIAESHVHGVPYEKVHFHEVGAIDSIIDIIGAAICFDKLGVDSVFVSTIELGGGTVKCAHGILPVPAPATAEIIKGLPVNSGGVDFEATTPTGAAILKTLKTMQGKMPPHRILKSGYGVGHRENPARPNLLRVFIAEPVEDPGQAEKSYLVECNIDDMNPEWYEHIMKRLFMAGADDVYFTSIMMKRNRPATKISVLCKAGVLDDTRQILFTESTSLGLRIFEYDKYTLERREDTIESKYGAVKIKYSYYMGKQVSCKPEYKDCIEIAERYNLSIREVYSYLDELINHHNDK